MANNPFCSEISTDPLLNRESSISVDKVDQQISRMIELRDQLRQQQFHQEQPVEQRKKTAWDEIREELNSMTDTQKELLFRDPEYQQRDAAIAAIAAQYQMQVLIPYVLEDEDGRKAIEAQLYTIRAKKDTLQKMEQEEMRQFRAWKEEQAMIARASQANTKTPKSKQ